MFNVNEIKTTVMSFTWHSTRICYQNTQLFCSWGWVYSPGLACTFHKRALFNKQRQVFVKFQIAFSFKRRRLPQKHQVSCIIKHKETKRVSTVRQRISMKALHCISYLKNPQKKKQLSSFIMNVSVVGLIRLTMMTSEQLIHKLRGFRCSEIFCFRF